MDILAGKLVRILGPYWAGKCPDIEIFNSVLTNFLEPGERVKADDGYRGHADNVKCPKNAANPVGNQARQGRVRARHKMLKGRLKNWGILSQVFRHDFRRHGEFFTPVRQLRSSPSTMVSLSSKWRTVISNIH